MQGVKKNFTLIIEGLNNEKKENLLEKLRVEASKHN